MVKGRFGSCRAFRSVLSISKRTFCQEHDLSWRHNEETSLTSANRRCQNLFVSISSESEAEDEAWVILDLEPE